MLAQHPLPTIAITADTRHFAGHHHVGCALDPINQALTATIEVIELRLGDGVVHVDRREEKLSITLHLVEAVNTRGGLFRQPLSNPFGSIRGTQRDLRSRSHLE